MTDKNDRSTELSPVKKALIKIQDLQGKLSRIQKQKKERLAVLGMSCRFPGGVMDADDYWGLLIDQLDGISELPETKWDLATLAKADADLARALAKHRGGFIRDIDQFDAEFFRISAYEAASMDPQQRLLLELSWQALEQANIAPKSLANSRTGVFIGSANTDYSKLGRDINLVDAFSGSGNALSVASGRLSYFYGFTGPSFVVDTACSSALVALHLACQSLRNGECDTAIVGAANLLLNPLVSVAFEKAGMLSRQGKCSTFDHAADGYVRSEGVAVLVLQRESSVDTTKSEIKAFIRGTAINQDGASGGLTVPNGPSQEAVIKAAIDNAGLTPADIGYIEAHGTGTPLGDPIEINALNAVFRSSHSKDAPLIVGSAKTNLGHMESCAGMGGLIKLLLATKHGMIPAQLNFSQANQHIAWQDMPLKVAAEKMAWPVKAVLADANAASGAVQGHSKIGGVSSFGFSGTNAHAIVEAPSARTAPVNAVDRHHHLLTLSSRTREGLEELVTKYLDYLYITEHKLADIAYTSHVGRDHFSHRLSVNAVNRDSARTALLNWQESASDAAISEGKESTKKAKIAFLFTGQGAQYAGMGQELYQSSPRFKKALDDCNALLEPLLGASVMSLMWGEQSSQIHQTEYTQPCLFALEYALANLWLSWGISPSIALGHSVGEFALAVIAKVMSLADACRLIAARGQLMQRLCQPSAMLAVLAPKASIAKYLQGYDGISIAAENSPNSNVLSGDSQQIAAIEGQLSADGIFCKALSVSHGFHSPAMEPMLDEFRKVAETIAYQPPAIKIVSTLSGQLIDQFSADYWVRHVREPVQFSAAIQNAAKAGFTHAIEIGPGSTLSSLAPQSLSEAKSFHVSLSPQKSDWESLLASLGKLYTEGLTIDWAGFDADYQRQGVSLPTYAFQKKRYWLEGVEHGIASGATLLPEWRYQLQWQSAPLEGEAAAETRTSQAPAQKHWLLVGDDAHDLKALQQALLTRQQQVSLVWPKDAADEAPEHAHLIDFAAFNSAQQDLQSLLASFTTQAPAQDLEVVFMMKGGTQFSVAQSYALANAFLALHKALIHVSAEQTPATDSGLHLWLLTEQTQLAEDSAYQSLMQAPLLAMAKVFGLEHPALWCRAIDVASIIDDNAAISKELLTDSAEDQVHWSAGKRLVRRLTRANLDEEHAPRAIDPEASYLITGGTGGIGLIVAQLLAQQGAKHLLLTKRSPGLSNEAQQVIDQLSSAGVTVRVERLDFTHSVDALTTNEPPQPKVKAKLLALLDTDRPLKGIIHAAGVSAFKSIAQISDSEFNSILAAKVDGSWLLHEVTRDLDLDFFVLCSSIASIWGSAGEVHYAAANQFLDSLAQLRQREGLAARVINWGPWANIGMAADSAELLIERGLIPMAPATASRFFAELLAGNGQHIIVNADWQKLTDVMEVGNLKPLFNELKTTAKPALKPGLIQEIADLAPAERQQKLTRHIQASIAQALHQTDQALIGEEDPLHQLGIDSLMAVEVRRDLEKTLGLKLPATLIFDYPSIRKMVAYIDQVSQGELQTDSQQSRSYANEAIAVIGIGSRYPKAEDGPEDFWRLLDKGTNAITDNPDRWPAHEGLTISAGVLENIKDFDADFFGISDLEALAMDPQQRIVLETAWSAIESAGYDPQQLKETKTGVFMGVAANEYTHIIAGSEQADNLFVPIGNATNVIAGRVSYTLGLEGPSMAIDTACSSSLVAIHTACQSLRNGECDMALAGGVNVLLNAETFYLLTKATMLSPTGRCHTFDQDADGYVRSEGCGVLVLKRLSDALEQGDPIVGVLKGSAINQDGRSSSLTAPNGPAQQRVIKAALANAGVEASDVSYVDAHGTGTVLGDPIELTALDTVYGQAHSEANPLFVSSVKTHIGHAESAAGVAGVIKTLMCLQRKAIPAHLHLNTLNPHIDVDWGRIQIPRNAQTWAQTEAQAGPRIGAVSSFGFSGTNAHILIQEAPVKEALVQTDGGHSSQILTISSKTANGLRRSIAKYLDYLNSTQDALEDISYTSHIGRGHYPCRVAVSGESKDIWIEKLTHSFNEMQQLSADAKEETLSSPRLAFMFTGQGAQYQGMGQALYGSNKVFREAIDACAALLNDDLGTPLTELLWHDDSGKLNHTRYTQPCLFALEYALGQLWLSWGIKPVAVSGHSIGEYAAAVIAGVMSLEDACRLINARASLMDSLCERGSMLAIMAPEHTIQAYLETMTQVAIAAVNGPASIVLAGPEKQIEQLEADISADGLFCKKLNVSHAFHSPMMQAMLAEFEAAARAIDYQTPQISFISTLTGQAHEAFDADYWVRHVKDTVRFSEALASLDASGISHYLEVGPGSTLLALSKQQLDASKRFIASLNPRQADQLLLSESVQTLYVDGLNIDWQQYHEDKRGRRVALPTYCFERKTYWPAVGSQAPNRGLKSLASKPASPADSALGRKIQLPGQRETRYENNFTENYPFPIKDHQVYATTVVPGAAHVAFAMELSKSMNASEFQNILYKQPLVLRTGEARRTQYVLSPVETAEKSARRQQNYRLNAYSQSADDETSEWLEHVELEINGGQSSDEPVASIDIQQIIANSQWQIDSESFYDFQWKTGLELSKTFRSIENIWVSPEGALSKISWPERKDGIENFLFPPCIIDAGLITGWANSFDLEALSDNASLAEQLTKALEHLTFAYVPFALERVEWSALKKRKTTADIDTLWVYIKRNPDVQSQAMADITVPLDIEFYDAEGQSLATIYGFRSRKAPKEALLKSIGKDTDQWFYSPQWQPFDGALAKNQPPGTWIILANQDCAMAASLAKRLADAGSQGLIIDCGKTSLDVHKQTSTKSYALDVMDEQAVCDLFSQIHNEQAQLSGVLNLLALKAQAQELDTSALLADQDRLCASLLHTVKALHQLGISDELKLVQATQNCQVVGNDLEQPEAIDSSSMTGGLLWGMVRTLSLEVPEYRPAIIDLPETDLSEAKVAQISNTLFAELSCDDHENQVAYRRGQRYVARLQQRLSLANTLIKQEPIAALKDSKNACLITGGLGGLGLLFAKWLAEQGVQNIILLTRRAATAQEQNVIDDIQQIGARIDVQQTDICDPVVLDATLSAIRQRGLAIKGVLHAAGLIHDGITSSIDWSDFRSVLAPKVLATWNLHQLTLGDNPDLFMLFSSISALFGSRGQANYSAANGFLDSFAAYRQSQGLPALSVNWGPWSDVGMAASNDLAARFADMALSPDEGLEAFARLLQAGTHQAGVMKPDTSFLSMFKLPNLKVAYYDALQIDKGQGDQRSDQFKEFISKLDDTPDEQKVELFINFLSAELASLLKLGGKKIDPKKPLQELGLDSLLALEIRNLLGSLVSGTLPATLLFDYPTLEKLSHYILAEMYGFDAQTLAHDKQKAAEKHAAEQEELQAISEIKNMSDEELNDSLMAELAKLNDLTGDVE